MARPPATRPVHLRRSGREEPAVLQEPDAPGALADPARNVASRRVAATASPTPAATSALDGRVESELVFVNVRVSVVVPVAFDVLTPPVALPSAPRPRLASLVLHTDSMTAADKTRRTRPAAVAPTLEPGAARRLLLSPGPVALVRVAIDGAVRSGNRYRYAGCAASV
jgi:hypothetical protein